MNKTELGPHGAKSIVFTRPDGFRIFVQQKTEYSIL